MEGARKRGCTSVAPLRDEVRQFLAVGVVVALLSVHMTRCAVKRSEGIAAVGHHCRRDICELLPAAAVLERSPYPRSSRHAKRTQLDADACPLGKTPSFGAYSASANCDWVPGGGRHGAIT